MSVRVEEMSPVEFVAARERAPIAYLPLGTIEWHEKHLPLGNDGLKAHGLCCHIAERAGGVVLPPLFWGVDRWGEREGQLLRGKDWNAGFPLPGSMYQLQEEVFRQLLRQTLAEVFAQGFALVVLMTGHNARNQEAIIKAVAAEYNQQAGAERVWAISEYEPAQDLFDFARDHAGKWETSLMMELRPELVDMDRLQPDPGKPLLAISGVEPRGEASRALGRRCVEETVQRACARIAELVAALPGAAQRGPSVLEAPQGWTDPEHRSKQ